MDVINVAELHVDRICGERAPIQTNQLGDRYKLKVTKKMAFCSNRTNTSIIQEQQKQFSMLGKVKHVIN